MIGAEQVVHGELLILAGIPSILVPIELLDMAASSKDFLGHFLDTSKKKGPGNFPEPIEKYGGGDSPLRTLLLQIPCLTGN